MSDFSDQKEKEVKKQNSFKSQEENLLQDNEHNQSFRQNTNVFGNDVRYTQRITEEDYELPEVVPGERIANAHEQEEPILGPRFVGIEKKFAAVQADDSDRMIRIRNALSSYHDAINDAARRAALNDIVDACNKYCFLRFSLFRGARGKQRLQEVRDLLKTAKAMIFTEQIKEHVGDAENATQQGLWRYGKSDAYLLADEMRKNIRKENAERNIDKDALRHKKKYKIHKLNEKQQDNNTRYILGSQQIKSIKDAIKEVMPGAYQGIDKGLTDKEAEEMELDLVHAEGTKLMEMGHDVIEFDVAGSSFDQFRKEHDGLHGITAHDDDTAAGRIYEEKMQKDGYLWKTEKQKLVGEGEEQRLATKTRYSIAGPWMLNMGPFSKWSIQATRKRIRDMGAAHLKPVFDNWRELESKGEKPKFHTIDLMFRGHSRGGVGASQGAMMLKYWVQENYPEYSRYVTFNLTQYDPVPGGDVEKSVKDGMERFDVKNYQGVNKGCFTIEGEKMAPLGEESGSTVLYSMVNQDDWIHEDLFSPQEVLHAKRLILMPFTHDIGLDLTHIDTTQMKDDNTEKSHAMAFINATDKKAYRSSGLNELAEGVYIMDENHVMVKVDSLAQLQNILMRTMPDTFKERRERILRAAASIFGDRQKMDEYASIDHNRNIQLSKAIEDDGNASEYRQAVKDSLRDLRTALKNKPSGESYDKLLINYEEAITSCQKYISKRDSGKQTDRGRRRLEDIKMMYSALIREKRHLIQKIGEAPDITAFGSFEELFMEPCVINRAQYDIKEAPDPTMGNVYRIEHSGSVAFFAEKNENDAKSASVISHMMEHAGYQTHYRAATEAVIRADDEHAEKKGIIYEQTYDLSYVEVMSSDFEYSRHGKVKMEKDAAEKLQRILAFDLLFGIGERLSGDYSTIRVSLQRHQAENTKEIARNGELEDIHDTYSIKDVCADLITSPLFTGGLGDSLTDTESKALSKFQSKAKKLLKGLTPRDLKEMAGSGLDENQLNILTSRLAAIKAQL